MFGFISNCMCAVSLCYLGMPICGACALVGGLVWLIPTGDED